MASSDPPPTIVSAVRVDVGVPVRILEEGDCDERLAQPPSCAPLGTSVIEFQVPPDSPVLSVLHIPVHGETIVAYLPANATDGDTLRMAQRTDGSWRLTKKSAAHAVILRAGYDPGHQVVVQVPDGSMLSLEVPAGTNPGDILDLKRLEDDSWVTQRVRVLPALDKVAVPSDPNIIGPYEALLGQLLVKDVLRRLPLDTEGLLHVSVPFCGGFLEFIALSNFLAEHCLQLPGVSGIRVLGTELFDTYHFAWALAERWCQHNHPKIELRTRIQDLSADPLPPAGLILALHPEVTKGGPWFGIVGSLLRSGVGFCVFATFFDHERQTVVNMAEMFRRQGIGCKEVESMENPFYQGRGDEGEGPPLRHLVFCSGSALRPL